LYLISDYAVSSDLTHVKFALRTHFLLASRCSRESFRRFGVGVNSLCCIHVNILLYKLFIPIVLCLLTRLAFLLTSPSSPPLIILSLFQLLVELVKFLKSHWNSGPTPISPCNNTRRFPFKYFCNLKPSPYILVAGEQEENNLDHPRAAFISTVNEVTRPLSSLTTDSSACGCCDLRDDAVGSTGTNLTNCSPLLPINSNKFMKSFTPHLLLRRITFLMMPCYYNNDSY